MQGAGAERHGTGGNGFPAIPRLLDGRRDVALSLGGTETFCFVFRGMPDGCCDGPVAFKNKKTDHYWFV